MTLSVETPFRVELEQLEASYLAGRLTRAGYYKCYGDLLAKHRRRLAVKAASATPPAFKQNQQKQQKSLTAGDVAELKAIVCEGSKGLSRSLDSLLHSMNL